MEPPKPICINLLVKEQQPRRQFLASAIIGLLLLAWAAGFWYWHGCQQKEMQALRSINSELKAELGRYKNEQLELQFNRKLGSQIEAKAERVNKLRQVQIRCADIYEEIAQVVPDGLLLTGIEINKQKVLINGYAPDYEELAAFISGLRKSPLLQNVMLISSNIDEGSEELYFRVEMGWEAGK